jgi:hypothetical protein
MQNTRETAPSFGTGSRAGTGVRMFSLISMVTFAGSPAGGQAKADVDHRAVVEIGVAGDRSSSEHSSRLGGTIAVEATPIERWLELESGLTILGSGARRQIGADLLLKKPFRISRTAEFMIGGGPEWSKRLGMAPHTTSWAAEAIIDFMFWPSNDLGWFVEPSYGYSRGREGERSLGATAGLLIGWP